MNRMLKTFCLMLVMHGVVQAQEIPNVKLTTLEGAIFKAQQFNELSSKPLVLSFWATWCVPCLNELTAVNSNLDDWKKELKFEFYAIAVDDSRTVKRVPAVVNGKGWAFNVLLDKNQDLKRELNIMNVPYTMVLKDGKVIYRQAGFAAGNEIELYKIIKENQ